MKKDYTDKLDVASPSDSTSNVRDICDSIKASGILIAFVNCGWDLKHKKSDILHC